MLDELATAIIERAIVAPVVMPELPPACKPGAILGGCAGVALFLIEAARSRHRPELAMAARPWLELARSDATLGPGFVAGASGVEVVAAIAGVHDDRPDVVLAAARAIETIAKRPLPTELYDGAAGIAWAAHGLLNRIPAQFGEARETLQRVRVAMTERVLAAYTAPLAPAKSQMLGMAHGIAGELWTLAVMLGAKHETVYARLEELAALRMADADDLVYWPPALDSEPEQENFGSFCNGMAGHTILWCEVARQLRDADTRELARDAATTTAALDSHTYSLCCGLAGQAIALRKYAELAGDANFARLADERLELAANDSRTDDRHELELWWGGAGIALAAWSGARLPCFE